MRKLLAVLLLTGALAACSSDWWRSPEIVEADLAIVGATVLPMTADGEPRIATVFVTGDRIVAIESPKRAAPSADSIVVDAAGKFIIPGLADMHVHIRDRAQLAMYAAYGVTLVRDMWGRPAQLGMKVRIEEDNTFAPSLVVAAPAIDGQPPTFDGQPAAAGADEARALVNRHMKQGYDFIKVYDRLSPAAFAAIVDAARELGVQVAGHAPFAVPLTATLASDIASIEHLQGYAFACARPEVGIDPAAIDPAVDFPKLLQAAARAQAAGEPLASLFDPGKRRSLAELTAANRVWNTPTLIALEKTNTPSAEWPAQFARPEVADMPATLLEGWRPENNFRFRFLGDPQLEGLRDLLGEAASMVAALHAAGAGLLLGTDSPEAFVVPGYSAHEELELLVEAGLTPLEALRVGTVNAATFLRRDGDFGIVARGALANLVLLDADPTADIANTRRIAGVVLRGEWYDQARIRAQLQRAAGTSSENPAELVEYAR